MMMAKGFKPVGWVAAVAGAALGCYMLSLNVAAERAELTKVERRIMLAQRQIRSLETELGTRGRLSQLEHWNAEVLALAAPTSAQFIDDAMTLARFDQRVKTIEDRAPVHMASAKTVVKKAEPSLKSEAAPKLKPSDYAAAGAASAREPQPLVRRASYAIETAKPIRAVAKAALVASRPAAAEKVDGAAGGQ